jgi:putative membrane protein insertion efficiency factor
MLELLQSVARLPARALDGLIWVYQRTVSPALVVINPHGGCRFAPTCSHYARVALREHGFLAGVVLTLVRLAKCGPWHPGGEDPVPARKFSCVKVTRTPLAES